MRLRSTVLAFATMLAASLTLTASAQSVVMQTSGGRTAESATPRDPIAAMKEIVAEVPVQLTSADPTHRGEVWLEISADAPGETPSHFTLRIPLSNTGDAYGESRSCHIAQDGSLNLIFTAGLDEANYIRFAAADHAKTVHLLVNKYLCRALAAPFICEGRPVSGTADWSKWQLGAVSRITLSSNAPASLTTGAVRLRATGQAFDSASCKVIAPSDGFCCVGGKTTAWHCGGTPTGEGWHQVSGECFHRETGASCHDGEPLELPH